MAANKLSPIIKYACYKNDNVLVTRGLPIEQHALDTNIQNYSDNRPLKLLSSVPCKSDHAKNTREQEEHQLNVISTIKKLSLNQFL